MTGKLIRLPRAQVGKLKYLNWWQRWRRRRWDRKISDLRYEVAQRKVMLEVKRREWSGGYGSDYIAAAELRYELAKLKLEHILERHEQ